MPSTATLLVPPLLAFAIAVFAGVSLAFLRQRARSTSWLAFDVVLLFALFPLPALAGLIFASPFKFEQIVPWMLAAILVSLPLAYLPTHLALARVSRSYRDTAHLLGMGGFARVFRVDLPLAWKAIGLGAILALTRVAGEWLLVIGAFDRLNPFTVAIGALALASAIGTAVAIDRLRPAR